MRRDQQLVPDTPHYWNRIAMPRCLPPESRRVGSEHTNLKSNELLHSDLPDLMSEVGMRARELVRTYPVLTGAVDAAASFLNVDPSRICLSAGSDAAIRLVVHALSRDAVGRTRQVISQTPNFEAWGETAIRVGCPVTECGSDCASALEIHERIMRAANASRGSILAITAPNGPAGYSVPLGWLQDYAQVAASREHILVVDACYAVFDSHPARVAEAAGPEAVVICSLSKSHALAGARIAIISAPIEMVHYFAQWKPEGCISGLTAALAESALGLSASFEHIWDDIRRERRRVSDVLRDAQIDCLPAAGNFMNARVGDRVPAPVVVKRLLNLGFRVRDTSELHGLSGCVRFTIGDRSMNDGFLATFLKVIDDAS